MNESRYQWKLIQKLRELFPGCMILKNDPAYMQGVPDIIILFNDRWAMLEIKISEDANFQANQVYYINLLNEMSYAAFVNPENEEDVLYDLQLTFGVIRPTRVSQSK
ncbi:MAG: hypothetical protein ABWY25_06385 [Paenisporosarcina sp.]